MFYGKSLVYLAFREVHYHCYGISDNFNFYSDDYCLCDRYQGCVKKLSASKDYFCVCRINENYSLEELNDVKHNSFKLERFYLNILRDLTEVLSFELPFQFWKNEYYNWICYTSYSKGECIDLFRLDLVQ